VSRTGLISLGVGLAAAGAGAALGVAAERLAVGRPLSPPPRSDPGHVPYGALRGRVVPVTSDDGTALHVEVDEPDRTPPPGTPTVVLCHGYCLTLDSWHHQRLALRDRHRLVLWDQRGHGRSARGPEGSATIDQLGRDLDAVLRAAAPRGPVVLVGHSMGGMTVMSYAAHHTEDFPGRVVGVALVSTSAGGLAANDFGLRSLGRLVPRVGAPVLQVLSRQPALVERSRRLGSDLEQILVRRWSYASDVDSDLVEFTARMIAETRIEVVSDFFPAFGGHDKREALTALAGIETLVLVGDSDLLTPSPHSLEIVRAVPHAEHVVVRDAGHLVMLEHPEVVTPHLVALVERASRSARRPGGRGRRDARA
jgi:pimeloyl-ACP methyl ester carboxylesterase